MTVVVMKDSATPAAPTAPTNAVDTSAERAPATATEGPLASVFVFCFEKTYVHRFAVQEARSPVPSLLLMGFPLP